MEHTQLFLCLAGYVVSVAETVFVTFHESVRPRFRQAIRFFEVMYYCLYSCDKASATMTNYKECEKASGTY